MFRREPAKTADSNCKKKKASDSKLSQISVTRNWDGTWKKTPGRLLGTSAVRFYQLTLSGFVGHGCRHLPTCSEYAFEAIARHGLFPGSWLALKRVIKCGPGGTSGYDPVPVYKEKK